MKDQLTKLKEIVGRVSDVYAAEQLLGWDQQVNMPSAAAAYRGQMIGTLDEIAHNLFTSAEVGQLLEDLQAEAKNWDPNSDDARLVKVTARQYEKRTKVPAELLVEFAQLTAVGHEAWAKARQEDDFSIFQPHLERILENRRAYARLFGPSEHVYDALLDDYEPGLKTAEVQAIFNSLRPQQVALVHAIAERPQPDDACLHQAFDEKAQQQFGLEVITRFGYDFQRGRLDRAVHPFCANFGIDDVRITTRYNTEFLNPALFGTMHETGHALYELGVDHALGRTPLASGASMALHESQSRMWENLVGRSLPFWEYFYPRLQATFPSQLGGVSLDTFYRAINKVEPSYIRVEADEATYNLHIMLRLELEIALLEGSLEVSDLPEAWNKGFKDYVEITPPNNRVGVLQDVHWSSGLFGYFATYALGNLVSVQLWERLRQDLPDLDDQMRRGEFDALRAWLGENIHRHGAKFEPQELVRRVTGSGIDPAPYMRYLTQKFGALYGV
jgi:carboxypeptidase Taq